MSERHLTDILKLLGQEYELFIQTLKEDFHQVVFVKGWMINVRRKDRSIREQVSEFVVSMTPSLLEEVIQEAIDKLNGRASYHEFVVGSLNEALTIIGNTCSLDIVPTSVYGGPIEDEGWVIKMYSPEWQYTHRISSKMVEMANADILKVILTEGVTTIKERYHYMGGPNVETY